MHVFQPYIFSLRPVIDPSWELGIVIVSYTSISRPECARLLDDAFGQDGEF